MEYFFSYKNIKTKLNLFFDIRYIDFVSLTEVETITEYHEREDNNEDKDKTYEDNNLPIKRRYHINYSRSKQITVTTLSLEIHFKNSKYYKILSFDKDDEEAYIIYNSLTEAISKNPQNCS